tara:strand:- start:343 stop:750 length:408 start_codon:yes stop_codon:yes gene_type:complete
MDLEVLKIASNTENHKIITDHTHISKQKNPLCGDEMEISLKIKNKKIVDFGYQSNSCVYCQASVSILSRKSINKSVKNIKDITSFALIFFEKKKNFFKNDWSILNKLFNEKNIARKECLILPFRALSKALKQLDE